MASIQATIDIDALIQALPGDANISASLDMLPRYIECAREVPLLENT